MVAHVSLPQFSVVSFARLFLKPLNCRPSHYYRNTDLSWLGNLCCPDFPTGNAKPGQKGYPFVPGLATGTKKHPFVPVGNTNRDKRCCQRHVPGAPFCPGWHQSGQRSIFFLLFLFSQLFFYFNYTFAFQLNLCIGIQCV